MLTETPPAFVEALESTVETQARRQPFGRGAWLAVAWLVFVLVVAVSAPVLPLKDPNAPGSGASLPVMTDGHLLGTDASRRDVLARLVYGARTSLKISLGAVTIGLLVGGALGLVAGFRRGRTDAFLSSVFDVILAFPQLVLALSMIAFLKPPPPRLGANGQIELSKGGLTTVQIVILALGIVSIPLLARITRATTLTWTQREFVTAGRAQGARGPRLMIREILPNVAPAMLSITLLSIGIAIIAEGGLSLLGLGVDPTTPSWGSMIADNRSVASSPLNALISAISSLFLTVLSLNYLGDTVRTRFDVRESAL